MIQLKNVGKTYRTNKGIETEALKEINLKIDGVGMIFLLGKSGSGKSTLLNVLGALDEVSEGSITVGTIDITKEKEDVLDCYRNSYVGFVFQDFNLLDVYNVYENIELALKFQEKSISQEDLDKKLKEFGLEGLGHRKINELSGGQKQRVAILRAIIKNPRIILADEPTGNLDATSSAIVFDILKEISKDKLVIVVSHETESAKKYADRIIELKDGIVQKDTGFLKEQDQLANLKSPYLPIKYAFKLALKNFFAKPLKLFFTVLLISISLLFATFTLNCNLFSKSLLIENTMQSNDNFRFSIYHISNISNVYGGYMINNRITKEKFNEFDSLSNSILNPTYSLYHNGTTLTFEYSKQEEEDIFFPQIAYISNYVELKDDRYIESMYGRLPESKNEFVVHEYFAKYILKYGVKDISGNIYKPKSIEELTEEKHPLKLGDNEVIITGVIKEDTSIYQESFQKNEFTSQELAEFYQKNYVSKAHTVYVKNFVDSAILSNPKEQVLEKTTLQINREYEQNIGVLKEEKMIFTENGKRSVSSLEQNEMILSLDTLVKIDEKFQDSYIEFLKKDRIEEKEFESFLQDYLKENALDNMTPILKTFRNNEEWVTYFPKIIGITTENKNNISHHIVENYEPYTKELTSINVYEPNKVERYKILKKVKLKELTTYDNDFELEYDLLKTEYMLGTTEVMSYYQFLETYILIITCVFMFFAILLFLNFLYTTITYSKKEIGILRSLGASKKDVTKIFLLESILVGIISYIFGMIGFFGIMSLINHKFTSKYFYHLNVIIFHPLLPITILLFTLLLIFLITIISIDRMSKIKPIDAILEK